MFTLKLLGGVALLSDAGPVVGRAVQKRRIAFLARLARAPQRAVSRDKLVGLLWPENDTEQARHLLSVSLHELRRALGEDAILSRGDDLVLGSTITSDVETFDATRTSDPEAAIRLYSGPFMDGFFASDSAELDAWVEGEREELKQAFHHALEQVARKRAEAGDLLGSVEAWRKLAAHNPYHGRIAYELMLAFDRAGDRAGALQHARIHETLLQTEFGTGLEDQVRELADKLRSGSTAYSAPRVVPVAATPASSITEFEQAAIVERGPPRAKSAGRRLRIRRRRWLIPTLVVVGAVSIARLIWISWTTRAPGAAMASVAVLPFRNIAASDSLVYFSDGITEEIINALSKVSGLHVASRTSAFVVRDSVDIRAAAHRLNVRHILEGTVRTGRDRMKISARLIHADDGSVKWSDDYDLPLQIGDILGTQEAIARSVVDALSVRLVQGQKAAALVEPTTNSVAALDAYYRGRSHYHKRTIPDLQRALSYFKQATELDPGYALAYAAIADVHIILGAHDYGIIEPRRAFETALEATRQALSLAPTLAEAHTSRAAIHFNYEWDWSAAERALKKAIDYNPGYAHAYHWYSLLLATQGRLEESRQAITHAIQLDPLSLVVAASYARNLYFAREFTAALAAYNDVIRKDPAFPNSYAGAGVTLLMLQQYDSAIAQFKRAGRSAPMVLPLLRSLTGYAHGLAGRHEQARAELRALDQYPPAMYILPEYKGLILIGLKEYDAAVAEFERAFNGRSGSMAYLTAEPILDPLRDHPRFKALVRKVGIGRR